MKNDKWKIVSPAARLLLCRLPPAPAVCSSYRRLPPVSVSAYLLPKRLALVILQAFPLLPEATSL
jgi:hypothetical protein